MKQIRKEMIDMNPESLLNVHSSIAAGVFNKFSVARFVSLRWIAMRKHVQIAFFCSSLSEWGLVNRNTDGKPQVFFDYWRLLVKTMQTGYLPELEAYYNCKIAMFQIFEPQYTKNAIYGFTVKVFSSPLFKNFGSHNALLEEKLGSSLAVYIRQQYGKGPGRTSAAILDDRFLIFWVSDLLASFPMKYADIDPEAMMYMSRMLKSLFKEAVEFVCCEQYGQTFESFFEIDIVENQMIALVLLEPLTEKDLVLD